MAAIVGALRAVLSLESAAFQKGLANAKSSLSDFDQKMKRIGGGMVKAGAAMSVVGAGIAAAIKGQLDAADDLSKAAQKFGVPIEELSRLKYAADLSGVSMETLGVSLGQLSKKMAAAMAGGKPAKVFKDLGVSIKDATGKMRPTEAVLSDIADKIAAMPDGAEKSALAMQLLGKSGAEMIPLLAGGGEALRQAGIEAEAMGLVIDQKTGKAAENFNDNLSRLKGTLTGLATQIMAQMAPAMERLSAMAVELTGWFRNLSPETQKWISVAAGIAVIAGPIVMAMGMVVGSLGTVAAALVAMGTAVLANPIGITIAAIAAGAALIYLNWDGIAEWFSELWGTVKEAFSGNWDAIKTLMLEYTPLTIIYSNWDGISGWFSKLWLDVKATFADGWAVIKQGSADAFVAYKSAWVGSYTYFSYVMTRVKDAISEGWNKIVALASAWAASFMQFGRDIVAGLQAGITEKWDAMVAWFKGKSDELTTNFKSWFGIQSPSKVFRRIGAWLTEGLGLGIGDNIPKVQTAMSGVAGTIGAGMTGLTDMAGTFKSAWGDAFKGFILGTTSARDALSGMASKMAEMFANQAFESLWSGGLGNALGGLFGFANGGVFRQGQVQAFANGGVVTGATAFGMRGGLGVMGEAGPEAIMPLTRGSNGKLGVMASGGGAGRVQVDLNVMSDPGVIVEIARSEAGVQVKQGLRQVPALMADYQKRKN